MLREQPGMPQTCARLSCIVTVPQRAVMRLLRGNSTCSYLVYQVQCIPIGVIFQKGVWILGQTASGRLRLTQRDTSLYISRRNDQELCSDRRRPFETRPPPPKRRGSPCSVCYEAWIYSDVRYILITRHLYAYLYLTLCSVGSRALSGSRRSG